MITSIMILVSGFDIENKAKNYFLFFIFFTPLSPFQKKISIRFNHKNLIK
jgi:hypothetical protein